ncbi:hypothetical protein BKA70DRAFT_1242537 [Coprinopsis sp. MPI-PUGE-AT-0042]|nr:hypothetical protein BKA70DRAFT_1242537 [Coprinopsis sp. MPI-PUGE-AT-0042]
MLAFGPSLPLEIIDNIVHATAALDDGDTLLRCALTSRHLCSIARRHFFSGNPVSLEIDDGRLRQLKGLLTSRNATIKAAMFKTWRFCIGPNQYSDQDQRSFRRLRDVVQQGNIDLITAFSLRYEVPPTALRRVPPASICRLIQSMEGLEALTLSAPFPTLSSIVAISSRLVRLHTLDLDNRYLEEQRMPNVAPNAFAALQSLTLSGPSVPLVEVLGGCTTSYLTHVSLVVCSASEFDATMVRFFEGCCETLKSLDVTLLDASSVAGLSLCVTKLGRLETLELVCRFREVHGFEDILGLVVMSFRSSFLSQVLVSCSPLHPHWSQKRFKNEIRRKLVSNEALRKASQMHVDVVWFGPGT